MVIFVSWDFEMIFENLLGEISFVSLVVVGG